MPDFADDVGVRIALLHRRAEGLPEGDIVDLLRHVEPPAVDAEVDPVARHVQQVLAHACVLDVELGQRRHVPPGVVVVRVVGIVLVGAQRPIVHDEPVDIGRIAAVLQDVMKGPEAAAGMVEDAIQHDLHMSRAWAASSNSRSAALPPSSGSTCM